MDPDAEAELMDQVEKELEFQEHANRLLELAEYLGVGLNPEDPRSHKLVNLIDQTGMGRKDAALMIAAKAGRAARMNRRILNEDVLYQYLAQNGARFIRPKA